MTDDDEFERRLRDLQQRWGVKYYKLDADNHVVETDLFGWAEFFETGPRFIDLTEITSQCRVSTVFLGLDHRFWGKGPPVVFETMIFGGPDDIDQSQWRYTSYDDAVTGHKAAVRQARAALKQRVK